MPKNLSLPDLRSVEGMVMLVRALVRALKRLRYIRVLPAIRDAASVRDATAYSLAIRWLLRQYRPRRFSSISRTIIWRNEAEMGRLSRPVPTRQLQPI
jgi:hypothetical protein